MDLAFNPRFSNKRDGFLIVPDRLPVRIAGSNRQLAQRIEASKRLRLAAPSDDALVLVEKQEPRLSGHDRFFIGVSSSSIKIRSSTETGTAYALNALDDLAQNAEGRIACQTLEDWADIPTRGYMLDISRCRVPTMESLLRLIDWLHALRFNQLQLYTEHTFAYRDHEVVWREASPITAAEVEVLARRCRERFIDFVPNQNSFGHMERWLRHKPYQPLAECPNGYTHPLLGPQRYGGTLRPNEASLDFVDRLHGELLEKFDSPFINVGCDETWELGTGWSSERTKVVGKHRVYLDHLLSLHRRVANRDLVMQFWGDIILEQPDLVKELPQAIIALVWGYETGHPFHEQSRTLAESGVPFYLVPGTTSWNSIGGRYRNARDNILAATKEAIAFDAAGCLLTDWGDFGHHHSPGASYAAICLFAAACWNRQCCEDVDGARLLNELAFRNQAPDLAQALVALGSASDPVQKKLHNRTLLNEALFAAPAKLLTTVGHTNQEELLACKDRCEIVEQDLRQQRYANDQLESTRGDALLAAELLKFAAGKALAAAIGKPIEAPQQLKTVESLIAVFRERWLSQSRPGGLEESVARLRAPLLESSTRSR